MAHSSMYQLRAELQGQIFTANNEWHHHKYEADMAAWRRDHKKKQLEVLDEQIAKAEEYDRQQWELAQKHKREPLVAVEDKS